MSELDHPPHVLQQKLRSARAKRKEFERKRPFDQDAAYWFQHWLREELQLEEAIKGAEETQE